MQRTLPLIALLLAGLTSAPLLAADDDDHQDKDHQKEKMEQPFKVSEETTEGSVEVEGKRVRYEAHAGTLIVHPKGWNDVPANNEDKDKKPSVASMFYVAYFKSDEHDAHRPVTFLYNGGPGSASMWLHMGCFGPRRIITSDSSHTPAAPYSLVNNKFSLLDASDLVFVDAPGTGFSRVAGKDRKKDFFGVDEDVHAFAEFITQFLSKYGRWNSPKYLFGESYGTTRSAALANELLRGKNIDLNGVIMLSQILAFDASPDGPEFNPGVELPYLLALPTYAATAWYHHKLPDQPAKLEPFLHEVEDFAMGEYAAALHKGAQLSDSERDAIAGKLHQYTGLPVDYIKEADLRINGGQFEKTLLGENDATTGRLDTRFVGPTMDPLSKESQYDPQSAAISSAYVAAINDYLRKELKFGGDKQYKPSISTWGSWDFMHQAPGAHSKIPQTTNVMPDLASAMKYNPDLKVMLNAGYFDLATPFYEGVYEMNHLQIPPRLQNNIEYAFYESGHMVYAHEPSLKQLHDKVASFIGRTSKTGKGR